MGFWKRKLAENCIFVEEDIIKRNKVSGEGAQKWRSLGCKISLFWSFPSYDFCPHSLGDCYYWCFLYHVPCVEAKNVIWKDKWLMMFHWTDSQFSLLERTQWREVLCDYVEECQDVSMYIAVSETERKGGGEWLCGKNVLEFTECKQKAYNWVRFRPVQVDLETVNYW